MNCVSFLSAQKNKNKYYFAFWFRHRIDHMTLCIDGENVTWILHDKGNDEERTNLSDQQKEVVTELINNKEKYYKEINKLS